MVFGVYNKFINKIFENDSLKPKRGEMTYNIDRSYSMHEII